MAARFTGLRRLSFERQSQLRDAHLPLLADLPALEHLSLKYEGDQQGVGIRALTQLRSLQLFGGSVADAWLRPVAALADLTALEITGCHSFVGVGLSHLTGLTALERLKLNGCDMSRFQSLARLTMLRELDFASQSSSHRSFDTALLQELTALQRLRLNGFKIISPREPLRMPALQALNLTLIKFYEGCNPFKLVSLPLPSLRQLAINFVEAEYDDYELLTHPQLSSITKLSLKGDDVPGLDDKFVAGVAALPALEELVLYSFLEITGRDVNKLTNLPALRRLVVYNCRLVSQLSVVFGFATTPVEVSFEACDAAW